MDWDHTMNTEKNGLNGAQQTTKLWPTPDLKNTQDACGHGEDKEPDRQHSNQ